MDCNSRKFNALYKGRALKDSKKFWRNTGEFTDDIKHADFNFSFADDRNIPVINFFNEVLGLTMSNNQNLNAAKCKTTIDAVFTRYFYKFESNIFVSYFSYHKPIISFL